jgi:hypothetical protein
MKRFTLTLARQDKGLEIGQHVDSDSWIQLRKLYDAAVKNTSEIYAERLGLALYSL